jgi:hypothetical protein
MTSPGRAVARLVRRLRQQRVHETPHGTFPIDVVDALSSRAIGAAQADPYAAGRGESRCGDCCGKEHLLL